MLASAQSAEARVHSIILSYFFDDNFKHFICTCPQEFLYLITVSYTTKQWFSHHDNISLHSHIHVHCT